MSSSYESDDDGSSSGSAINSNEMRDQNRSPSNQSDDEKNSCNGNHLQNTLNGGVASATKDAATAGSAAAATGDGKNDATNDGSEGDDDDDDDEEKAGSNSGDGRSIQSSTSTTDHHIDANGLFDHHDTERIARTATRSALDRVGAASSTEVVSAAALLNNSYEELSSSYSQLIHNQNLINARVMQRNSGLIHPASAALTSSTFGGLGSSSLYRSPMDIAGQIQDFTTTSLCGGQEPTIEPLLGENTGLGGHDHLLLATSMLRSRERLEENSPERTFQRFLGTPPSSSAAAPSTARMESSSEVAQATVAAAEHRTSALNDQLHSWLSSAGVGSGIARGISSGVTGGLSGFGSSAVSTTTPGGIAVGAGYGSNTVEDSIAETISTAIGGAIANGLSSRQNNLNNLQISLTNLQNTPNNTSAAGAASFDLSANLSAALVNWNTITSVPDNSRRRNRLLQHMELVGESNTDDNPISVTREIQRALHDHYMEGLRVGVGAANSNVEGATLGALPANGGSNDAIIRELQQHLSNLQGGTPRPLGILSEDVAAGGMGAPVSNRLLRAARGVGMSSLPPPPFLTAEETASARAFARRNEPISSIFGRYTFGGNQGDEDNSGSPGREEVDADSIGTEDSQSYSESDDSDCPPPLEPLPVSTSVTAETGYSEFARNAMEEIEQRLIENSRRDNQAISTTATASLTNHSESERRERWHQVERDTAASVNVDGNVTDDRKPSAIPTSEYTNSNTKRPHSSSEHEKRRSRDDGDLKPEAIDPATVTCCICLDIPTHEELSSINGCSHPFCFTCIEKWADRENTCPLCKARFLKIEKVNRPKKRKNDAAGSESDGKVRSSKRVRNRDQRSDINFINPLQGLFGECFVDCEENCSILFVVYVANL